MSDTFKKLLEQAVSEVAGGLLGALKQGDGSRATPDGPSGESLAALLAWKGKLSELEASLARFPHVLEALGEPASDSDIANANSALFPFRLPSWLEELYRWHNGSAREASGLFDLHFGSLDDALRSYRSVSPFDLDFGEFREFTFQFLGSDDGWVLAILDQDFAYSDDSLLYWQYHEIPVAWHQGPQAWVDDLLHKLESVDEDSFDDQGRFMGYKSRYATVHVPVSYEYGGANVALWPESYRQRAGLTNLLIQESKLPPLAERRLVRGVPIPHAGPWEVYFGGFAHQLFTSRSPKLPALIRLATNRHDSDAPPNVDGYVFDCVLPRGVISDYTLRHGFDLDAVVWFRPETITSDMPVIDKVRFPVNL